MKYTIVNQHGDVAALIECPESQLKANTPEGCTAISGRPPFTHARYVEGLWTQLPVQPSMFHKWDSSSSSWIDTRSPVEVIGMQRESINQKRTEAISTFRWNGHEFDADVQSRNTIMAISAVVALTGSLPAAYENYWRTSENLDVLISTPDEWASFVSALANHDINQHKAAVAAKELL